jgi:hypothetical protein
VVFAITKFFIRKIPIVAALTAFSAFAFATLCDAAQIKPNLFVLYHPRSPDHLKPEFPTLAFE